MKNVLLVIDNLGSGGAQNQLIILAIGLKKLGFRPTVFVYYPESFYKYRLEKENIPILYIGKKGKIGINIIVSLIKVIQRTKVDCIISFMDTPNLYAVLSKKLSGKKVKVVISYRSNTNIKELSLLSKNVKRLVNYFASHIVANSEHEKNNWIKFSPYLRRKFHTIYNAIDSTRFNFTGKGNPPPNVFIVVGSVSKDKNGILILEALQLLREKGLEVYIHWFGQKVYKIAERKEYLNQMEEFIEKHNLHTAFIWNEPVRNIEDKYINYKALILASEVEGLPNVVCEAMACGLPCIVSNVLDHPKIVEQNRSGYLFDVGNKSSLADAIERMLYISKEEYQKMSFFSASQANKLFKEKVFINKYIELINA